MSGEKRGERGLKTTQRNLGPALGNHCYPPFSLALYKPYFAGVFDCVFNRIARTLTMGQFSHTRSKLGAELCLFHWQGKTNVYSSWCPDDLGTSTWDQDKVKGIQ